MNPLDIHIPEEGEVPPFEQMPYYFPTKKGWMLNMPTLFGIGQTKMDDDIPGLPDIGGSFRLNDRRFPEHFILQAHGFFRAVWERQKTESSLYILYNREVDDFKLWAPLQYVTGTSVNHKLESIPAGWAPAGTIHSHCNFSAFHSGTDQHDMDGQSGLHITIGHVDKEEAEFAVALSLNDTQFDVEYDSIIAPSGMDDDPRFKTHWLQFVKQGNAPWNNGTITKYAPKKSQYGYGKGYTPPKTHYPSKFKPSTPMQRSAMQNDWDWQAWGNEDEDYGAFLRSHEPTKPVGSEDALVKSIEGTDAPSDIFNYYREEIADFQYDLNLIGDQLAELGFDFDWSIAWNPTGAQQRMFDDAPTP
jgi:hypothetical protein